MLQCSNYAASGPGVSSAARSPYLRLNSMGPQTIVIKKYENRRLYDSTHSRYVNLDEVAQMVRDGRDVQVVDAATGEDRTRAVLTQIVVEHAKDDNSAFPLDVLRQMVVASGRVTNEAALTYMRGVFDMYQNAYRAVSPVATPHAAAPTPPPAASAVPHRGEVDVDALKKRLEELESVVSGIKSKPAARKPRPEAPLATSTQATSGVWAEPDLRSDSPRRRSAPRP